MKTIAILGTRGIPANHGGFETFVESLAPYLVEQGFKVSVYCQKERSYAVSNDVKWKGVRLVEIVPQNVGALATAEFDLKSIQHVVEVKPDLVFVFGYNTALFCAHLNIHKIPFVMNMDGLEWKRKKWNCLFKLWLALNERLGCWFADHLIADHPEIQKRLERFVLPGKITMIPYGADLISGADEKLVRKVKSLEPNGYGVYIGRPEPENHVLEMVRAFSMKKRGLRLVVLGDYKNRMDAYKRSVVQAASDEVYFPGAIYDTKTVEALLFYSRFYCHGHSAGGTNPSLVQAMAAGCRMIAHDNPFNRGVLRGQGDFFANENQLDAFFEKYAGMTAENLSVRPVYPTLLSPAEINRRYLELINLMIPA